MWGGGYDAAWLIGLRDIACFPQKYNFLINRNPKISLNSQKHINRFVTSKYSNLTQSVGYLTPLKVCPSTSFFLLSVLISELEVTQGGWEPAGKLRTSRTSPSLQHVLKPLTRQGSNRTITICILCEKLFLIYYTLLESFDLNFEYYMCCYLLAVKV